MCRSNCKPDHLKIEPDHVLADMLRAMHLIVQEVEEAFEPEGGAYSAGGHGHAQAIAARQLRGQRPCPRTDCPWPCHAPHRPCHGPRSRHVTATAPRPCHAPQAVQPVAIQIHPRKPHSH